MREGVSQGLMMSGLYLLSLVALPVAALWRAPPELIREVERVGLDPVTFVKTLAALGIVMAALAAVEAMASRGTLERLLASTALTLSGLVLAVYVISAGQIWSLGNPSVAVTVEDTAVSVSLRLRFVVLLLALGAVLRIASKVAEYRESLLPPIP